MPDVIALPSVRRASLCKKKVKVGDGAKPNDFRNFGERQITNYQVSGNVAAAFLRYISLLIVVARVGQYVLGMIV